MLSSSEQMISFSAMDSNSPCVSILLLTNSESPLILASGPRMLCEARKAIFSKRVKVSSFIFSFCFRSVIGKPRVRKDSISPVVLRMGITTQSNHSSIPDLVLCSTSPRHVLPVIRVFRLSIKNSSWCLPDPNMLVVLPDQFFFCIATYRHYQLIDVGKLPGKVT